MPAPRSAAVPSVPPEHPTAPWGASAARAKGDVQVKPRGLPAKGLDFPLAWQDGLGEVASTLKSCYFLN